MFNYIFKVMLAVLAIKIIGGKRLSEKISGMSDRDKLWWAFGIVMALLLGFLNCAAEHSGSYRKKINE